MPTGDRWSLFLRVSVPDGTDKRKLERAVKAILEGNDMNNVRVLHSAFIPADKVRETLYEDVEEDD